MSEENKKSESGNDQEGATESLRTAARRTQREARRSTGRSTSLKRKVAEPNPQEAKEKRSIAAKKRPRAKTRTRRPTAEKEKNSTEVRPQATSSIAAKKKRAKPAKTTRTHPAKKRASKTDDDEFEIRSQPDGISRRFKVTKLSKAKKKVAKKPTQRFMSQEGPGPAIVDLSTVSPGIWSKKPDIKLGHTARETSESVKYLKRIISVTPKVAIVLGSGLSMVSDLIEGAKIPFSEIPGFSSTAVAGHPGYIRAGLLSDIPVMFIEGRRHYYETGSMEETVRPVLTALALGASHLILTTSAGAINTSYKPGEVMMVKDHINMMGDNPLFGKDPSGDPSIFVDCGEIYNQSIIGNVGKLCRAAGIKKRLGTLAGVRGPVYETPTEKAWLKYMGVDAVCMSVIPEALASAYLGVKVTGLALITNPAFSRKKEPIRHEDVVSSAKQYVEPMQKLISLIVDGL